MLPWSVVHRRAERRQVGLRSDFHRETEGIDLRATLADGFVQRLELTLARGGERWEFGPGADQIFDLRSLGLAAFE